MDFSVFSFIVALVAFIANIGFLLYHWYKWIFGKAGSRDTHQLLFVAWLILLWVSAP